MLRPARLRAGRADGRHQGDSGSRAPDRPQAAVEHTEPARLRPFRRGSMAAGGAGIAFGLRPTHLARKLRSIVTARQSLLLRYTGRGRRSNKRPWCTCCHANRDLARLSFKCHVLSVPPAMSIFATTVPCAAASAFCPEVGAFGNALAEYLAIAAVSMTSKQTVCLAEAEPVVPRARGMACAGDGEGSEKRECANRPTYSLRSHGSSLLHVAVRMTGESSEPPHSGTTCGANQP